MPMPKRGAPPSRPRKMVSTAGASALASASVNSGLVGRAFAQHDHFAADDIGAGAPVGGERGDAGGVGAPFGGAVNTAVGIAEAGFRAEIGAGRHSREIRTPGESAQSTLRHSGAARRAEPESSHAERGSGFRVHALRARPGMTTWADRSPRASPAGAIAGRARPAWRRNFATTPPCRSTRASRAGGRG